MRAQFLTRIQLYRLYTHTHTLVHNENDSRDIECAHKMDCILSGLIKSGVALASENSGGERHRGWG